MDFSTALRAERLVAIIRGKDAEASFRTVMTLAEEDIPLVEVSLSGHDALTVIGRARAELGDAAWLGAGTVLSAGDARRAAEAGANLVVTPGLGAGLEESVRQGLPTLAGVLTPSEVIAADALGVSALKLFPASVGGPGYLQALRAPFPELPFVPVGGVDAATASAYFAAGAVAVGVGSPLIGDAADGGDLDALRGRAAEFKAACAR
ncbi:bifunctional 4-hydroxy-2-oxoglutarate aldolase/2-dehydro-3-deoxy-phosphogluconate aldolase [Streptomyces sp. NPDC048483]|uniref:bifunctional 4-hydroxy-2-oxoglutarate aldolase/2-dehydro-3-deoxy-phosphogluconate aldolase n=1 Tax=Streptomyces sp. NPDC048483 TaxID=3154927 RepID=UPI00341C7D4F